MGDYAVLADNIRIHNGRLAQLVEHLFDVERVIGSNPVPPTIK